MVLDHEKNGLHVRVCECGAVKVTIGQICLHLQRNEFDVLASVIGKTKEALTKSEPEDDDTLSMAFVH